MNVLFYIDPHVIRQNPLGYSWVVNRLYNALCAYELHKDGQEELAFKLLVTKYEAPPQPFIVTLPDNAGRELMKFNCKWDETAMEQWELLMCGQGLIAEIYYDILYYLMKKHAIDAFLYWGSNHTVRKFADSFGIYSFAMELGPTRQPFFETACFDPLGVNGDAYSSGLCLNEFPGCDISRLCYSLRFEYDFFSSAYRPIRSAHAKSIYREGSKILVPLQLDDDSNCILHSDYGGMEDFVRDVVPQLVENNHIVFVKPHPGAHPSCNKGGARRMNVEAHQRCEAYIKDEFSHSGRVIWLDDIGKEDYLSLLTKMNAVITINSSVGFEALLLGRVVTALGRAPYNISNRLPTLENILNSEIDPGDYSETAGKIANIMLNYYLYPIEILDDLSILSRALDRGIAITDQYRSGGYDAIHRFVRNNPINYVG
jgi:hypothetical protein